MREIIEERRYGTRTIAGTDWPVSEQIVRDQRRGQPEWIVVRGLCNGVPESSTTHKTLAAAREDFGASCDACGKLVVGFVGTGTPCCSDKCAREIVKDR